MSAQGDCEFLVQRARELVPQDLWAAKAWLITARSLYPADFNIQVRPGGRAGGAAPTDLRPPASHPPREASLGTPGPAGRAGATGASAALQPGPRRVPRGKGCPRGRRRDGGVLGACAGELGRGVLTTGAHLGGGCVRGGMPRVCSHRRCA